MRTINQKWEMAHIEGVNHRSMPWALPARITNASGRVGKSARCWKPPSASWHLLPYLSPLPYGPDPTHIPMFSCFPSRFVSIFRGCKRLTTPVCANVDETPDSEGIPTQALPVPPLTCSASAPVRHFQQVPEVAQVVAISAGYEVMGNSLLCEAA